MDFFQNQEVARKKTGLLVFYFVLAVTLIILSVYVAIAAVLQVAEPAGPAETIRSADLLWNPELFGMVALGASSLIAGGSLYKIAALSGGGHTVAELLVVTGLPARDIRESLRLMRIQRAIVTTDREGKTAYALPGD